MESDVSIKWWKRRTEMERIPQGVYMQEFREQAVLLHEVDGLMLPEVAKRL